MSISSNVSSTGDLIISIDGIFDFNCRDAFKSIYEPLNDKLGKPKKVKVDMQHTEHVDSAALGLLLMMREHLGGTSAEISLLNCSDNIKGILNTANFKMLFNIS